MQHAAKTLPFVLGGWGELFLQLAEHFSDLPGQLRPALVIPVAVHFLPDVRPGRGRRGNRGAVVGVAEALPLQDVLGVLPLQVAGQHGGVGHAAGGGKRGERAKVTEGSHLIPTRRKLEAFKVELVPANLAANSECRKYPM